MTSRDAGNKRLAEIEQQVNPPLSFLGLPAAALVGSGFGQPLCSSSPAVCRVGWELVHEEEEALVLVKVALSLEGRLLPSGSWLIISSLIYFWVSGEQGERSRPSFMGFISCHGLQVVWSKLLK